PAAPPVLPQRFAPAPGIYTISANQLQGLTIALPEMFNYFHHLEPERRIGHAMFVYHLAPRPPADWVAQCALPVAPLSPADLAEGLGTQEYQLLTLDCEQSWLIPPGNGWYVLPHAYDGWGKRQAEQGRLAYEQPQSGYAPAFALYEWFDEQTELPDTITVYAAPSVWPVSQVLAAGIQIPTPVDIGDALTFLGYTTPTDPTSGTPWSVTTYWQVRARPTAALSLMAHLLEGTGIPLAVGDGLGVPFNQWQPGSLILQRHHFAIPENTSATRTWLQVGAYTLEDLERAPIQHAGQIVGDRLLVAEIEVTTP
ncbi:MAG: hypothetical protein U9Q70_07890, partial [Chloroflexota bacterium]|nr:hypothetical protein [Chloroflexota bacterium]